MIRQLSKYLMMCFAFIFWHCSHDDGIGEYFSEDDYPNRLVISEILPTNLDWLDEEGADPGWVELYNGFDSSIYLSELFLSDKRTNLSKWSFGEDSIPAKNHRIVFCDKKNKNIPGNVNVGDFHYRFHSNWKLDEEGGVVYLSNKRGEILDSVEFPYLAPGVSYGLKDYNSYAVFSEPTPENFNSRKNAYTRFSDSVIVETAAGFYKDSVFVRLSRDGVGGTIRCTQDGSMPTEKSSEYKSEIKIKKNAVLRCATFNQGELTKFTSTQSFFINEKIDLPVVSVSVDPQFLKKIYDESTDCKNPCKEKPYWDDLEFPAHVEYFEKGSLSEEKSFEIDVGLSIAGNNSRAFPKKTVALKIKEQYQHEKLTYPLFDLYPEKKKFKSLLLRNFGNRYNYDFLGNGAFTYLLDGTGVDFQRSHPVVVFYNGIYYGIHEFSERLNEHFIETNYAYDRAVVVKHTTTGIESDGDLTEYSELLNFINEQDFSGDQNENYEYVKSQLDVNNFALYMAFEIYGRNMDWPNNNSRAWKAPETQWKYIVYDIDFAFANEMQSVNFPEGGSMFSWIRKKNKTGNLASIYCSLIKNPDFKRMFINNSMILFNDYLTKEKMSSSIDRYIDKISASEMKRDVSRFVRENDIYRDGEHVKQWASLRDSTILQEYKTEFKLGNLIQVSIKAEGDGLVSVDGFVLPNNYSGTFLKGNAMLLFAHSERGSLFNEWEDGSTENPRLVKPYDKASFIAKFK